MKSSFLLPALLHSICVFAAPAPYIVTNYVEISVYTARGQTTDYTTYSESLFEYTNTVVPTATPVTDAISTYTDDASYAQVTIVEVVLPPGSGRESTVDYGAYSASSDTSYVVPITYTPSATCTSQSWTFVTNVPITIPRIVQSLISPVTVSPSATTYSNYYNERLTRTTVQIAVLNPTDVAAEDLEFASSLGEPYGLSYCYTPTTYCPTRSASATCTPTFAYASGSSRSGSGSSSGYYDGYGGYCYSDSCWIRNLIIIAVCVPVGWILLWLIIGMWESWMSFKGIMLGKHRKRGMPYSWCCISFLFLCWVGPAYKAKSVEEQAELKEKWKALKAGEKFKLWMTWGFRWKYPDMLGEEPEKDKRAFRQRCL